MVPFFGLDREYQEYKVEYQNIFDEVMTHGKVLQGNEVKSFEKNIANSINRKYAVAVNSATDSLYYSLVAYGIKEGDEVLVSNFSFIATVSCIVRANAKPVFCDIDKSTYHISIDSIKKMTSPNTKAIVFPHMFGNMNDMSEILNFCVKSNIIFIEDAAQSFGASYNNIKAGSIGECSSISFDPTKVLGAPGSGGVFLTDDKEKADTVKMLRYHGKNTDGDFECLGFNSQMPSLTAKMLDFKLSQSLIWEIKRQKIANVYNNVFRDLDIIYQEKTASVNHIFHKYVLRFKTKKIRNDILNELKENDVQAMIHYKSPLSKNKLFDKYSFKSDKLTNVTLVCDTVLSLPCHPWLSNEEINTSINIIKRFKL